MSIKESKSRININRRQFLQASALGVFCAPRAGGEIKCPVIYRTLGRTGLKISVIGFGALLTREPAVFQAGFDRGINYVDTARVYMNGKNEEIVGRALKGYRDKVYVATKFVFGSKKAIINSVEKSLSELRTDYIDVLQLHNMSHGPENPMHEDVKGALSQLKKEGKTRFVGVTTHKNEVQVIKAVINDPDKTYDTILVKYNFASPPDVKQAIAEAAAKNIGIIAMKTQGRNLSGPKAEGLRKHAKGLSSHQAALKFILQDEHVTCAIPSMVNLKQIIENIDVMRSGEISKLTGREDWTLKQYQQAVADDYCHFCGECESTCSRQVEISTVHRSLMYANSHGDMELALSTYASIDSAHSPNQCLKCKRCEAICVRGLDIPAKLAQARELLG